VTRYGAAESPGERRFGGLTVPDPAFADDDGTADPRLAEALAAYADAALDAAALGSALAGARLMVPLVAVLDEVEEVDGLRSEKSSHMATVTLVAEDGRRGLLAFTSVAAMAAWDPAARGIPARAETVAAAALEEDASAVLLDVAGPRPTALARPLLADVCAADPATVRDLVTRAVPAVTGLVGHSVHVEPGDGEESSVTVLLDLAPGAEASAGDIARAVAQAVSADRAAAAVLRHGLAIGLTDATGG
jgi:hypothetical protein